MSAAEASAACSFILEMREKIRTQPQKYSDYVMEGNTLYRNIPLRAGGDVATWKMCVPKALRETVRKKNHDSKPKDNSTSGSSVLLARNAQRRRSPRARMRDMHEIQAESDGNGWENADAGARGTMGYGMCGRYVRTSATKCWWY